MKTITLKQYRQRLNQNKYSNYYSVVNTLLKILDKYKSDRRKRFNEFIKYNKIQVYYENNR